MEDITSGKKVFVFSLLFLALLIFIPAISAQETFDNVKSFDSKIGNYGKYEIRDWFGLQKLQDVELKSNSATCFWKFCEAEKEIIMHQDGILVDDIRFLENGQEVNIQNYKFYIKNGDKKIKYIPGTEVKAGTYTLILEGELERDSQVVDWQIMIGGKYWTEEWALWNGGDAPISYWNFDETTGSVLGNKVNITFNGSLKNMENEDWKAGKINNGLEFDGVNEYIEDIGRITALEGAAQNYTIALWIKSDSEANTIPVFGYSDIAAAINPSELIFFQQTAASSYNPGDGVTSGTLIELKIDDGNWHFMVFVKNSTHIKAYKNNTLIKTIPAVGMAACSDCTFNISEDYNGDYYDGMLDEIGIWNRSLTPSEINKLWNDGDGLGFETGEDVTLVTPLNNTILNDEVIVFNFSLIEANGGFELRNATINLWYNNGTLSNKTTKIVTGTTNISNFSVSSLNPEKYLWNVQSCSNSSTTTRCNFASENFTFTHGAETNSITFENSAYQTESQTFSINITSPSGITPTNALLNYNGTDSALTINSEGNNIYTLNKDMDIPIGTGLGNKTFYFKWDLDSFTQLSTNSSHIVNNITLALCNATYPIPFINFTFRDEETLARLNATADLVTWSYYLGAGDVTKSLIYTNITGNPSYAFCFSPPDKTLHNTLTFQYAATGYPQRIHYRDSDLTNIPVNQTLYLLATADGIYSSIQTVNTIGSPVTGVNVVIERQFSGVWTIIGTDVTDSSGIVTFWVNPDFDHRLTFTKIDCTGTTQTIRPTQATYTQTLNCQGGSEAVYISQIEGLRYTRGPRSGVLEPGVTNFTYTLFSEKSNIVDAKFELTNATNGVVLNSTSSSCTPTGCILSFTHNFLAGAEIKGRYYVDIGNGDVLLEADAFWRLIPSNVSDTGTLKQFWQNFATLFDEWGADEVNLNNKIEYSRFVFIFMFLAIIIALFNKAYGNYDGQYPGALAIAITVLIWTGSLAGGLTGQGFFYYSNLFGNSATARFMNNYILAILSSFMAATIILATTRRNS